MLRIGFSKGGAEGRRGDNNPSVKASLCQLPLHRGALGGASTITME